MTKRERYLSALRGAPVDELVWAPNIDYWLSVNSAEGTLPFDLTVKDPDGHIRDDLSGVRVVENGVYVFAMDWPVAAKAGNWSVTVTDKISGASDVGTWEAK